MTSEMDSALPIFLDYSLLVDEDRPSLVGAVYVVQNSVRKVYYTIHMENYDKQSLTSHTSRLSLIHI